ncbi:glycosyltransferase [Candidatus Parcubacteria bacterium]|nr:glycosyltransferase [Candidatus Parcubacteria bacterium]
MAIFNKINFFLKIHSINSWVVFYILVYIVLIIKLITITQIDTGFFFKTYSIVVSLYILSRFIISYFYDHKHPKYNIDYEPTVAFGIPSKNEGENIRETILRIANTDYPVDKFEIIAVNDGSDDNTLQEMLKAKEIAKKNKKVLVKVINWKKNRGKRDGMAECVRQSNSEVIIFIDSDSFVEPNTTKELIKYFSDKNVAAVAGHAYVANANINWLTKMQDVRYYVAFKAYKGAEAIFGAVTCCSGCCSAYRTKYVRDVMNDWLSQYFLGVRCTYGDDRSLTNFILRKGYITLYSPSAASHTFVPSTLAQFMKQQLRWKKSWIRESLIAATFIWKRHPIMSTSYLLGVALTLLAPVVVIRTMIWFPFNTGEFPYFYLIGLLLMATIYGMYYYAYKKNNNWIYGVIFSLFYTLILIWQLPYAIITIRDTRWGTR